MPRRKKASRDVGNAPVRPVFRKGLGRLTGLVLVNGLFEFLSFGLFRFWSRARLRRFYWNHAVIDGAPLEYDGRGEELLAGFLRAVAVLLVPGTVIFVGAIALMGAGAVLGPASLAFMLVLLPLVPVALYRARAYRLSRTCWRGIAFHQDGSAWRYARLWLFWLIACFATLGLAVPWRNAAAQGFRVNHTLYGDMRFAFDGRGTGLIGAWLLPWACGAAASALTAASILEAAGRTQGLAVPQTEWAVGLGLAFLVLFFRYRTVEFRYFVRHTSLGPLRFRSRLRSPVVLTLILPYLAISLVLLAVNLAIIAHLAQTLSLSRPGEPAADLMLFLLLLMASVLVLTIAMSLSYNLLVRYGLLRAVCGSLEVEHLPALADAAPAHAPRPRRGEGIAEAFDMAAL